VLWLTSMLIPRFSKGWPSANAQSRDKFQESFGRNPENWAQLCDLIRSWIVVRIGPFLSFMFVVGGDCDHSAYIWGCYLCVVGVVLLQAAWRLSPSKPTLALLPGRGGTPGGSGAGAGAPRWPPPRRLSWSLPPSRGFQIGEPSSPRQADWPPPLLLSPLLLIVPALLSRLLELLGGGW
jgi:hypothetical protein